MWSIMSESAGAHRYVHKHRYNTLNITLHINTNTKVQDVISGISIKVAFVQLHTDTLVEKPKELRGGH